MNALVLVLAATPTPSPTVESTSGGSPGFIGFVVTFALAVAAAGLFLSLTRHLRRVDRRAKELRVDDEGADLADATGDAASDAPAAERDARGPREDGPAR